MEWLVRLEVFYIEAINEIFNCCRITSQALRGGCHSGTILPMMAEDLNP